MELILIDGGPASGKNTIGTLLVKKFLKNGIKSILLDLDTYVEEINPSWIWKDKQQENIDQLKAREKYIRDINKYIIEDFTVISIGERFLTKEDLNAFISRLSTTCPIFLYHLSVPLYLRKQRLHKRGPHSLIDLEKDQKERDSIQKWYGYIYENVNSPEEDVLNLSDLIQQKIGLLNLSEIK
ncbi:MAG: hypothetical protein A2905_06720 [Candidatus Levybacteria bacterium RIFCSPLOWO2_01_FULL_36_10]|nr:MAG: hypothetical protein A2905_06720 [Candidatus Levybacteria bacterium RIFCSPLOWO2_01_FULL_36_10]